MNLDLNQPLFWLYLINLLLVITALLHMLYQRRSPQNLVAWLLTLILLPFLGILLYLIFGSRKLLYKKRIKPNIAMHPVAEAKPHNPLAAKLDTLLRANHIAGTTRGNRIHLCSDGQKTFTHFMEALNNSQSQIHLETYIFELDQTGQTILEGLIRKAKEGVEVRLLMDSVGSFSLYRNPKALKPLQDAGGQFAFFQPVFKAFFNSQVNLRNHRKIYLFDHATLFTGGMNLSNDYLGAADDNLGNKRWIDLMLEINGPVSLHYQNIFQEDWRYATGETLASPQPDLHRESAGEILQAIPSGPDIESDALFETLLHSIHLAQTHIQIVTPYFIPDSAIMHALLIALKRGVKVTVITPESSDHLIFDIGRSSYMRELYEAGARLCSYSASMLHAKLVLIDDQSMLIGSANLDYRSLFINHEMANVIYSEPLIKQMTDWTENLIQQSTPYQPSQTRGKRLLENLGRIFAPIL